MKEAVALAPPLFMTQTMPPIPVNHITLPLKCVTIISLQTIIFCEIIILSQLNIQTMDTNEIEGNWNVEKGKLKQKFALLTDDYQLREEIKNKEMMNRLQIKLGKTKEELHQLLADLFFISFLNRDTH